MEINHVRYFLALCEERNFNRAAKRCGVTQPSLTNAIKRLESLIGGTLFIRRPNIQPTELALAIKPHFEHIMQGVALAIEAANRLRDHRQESRWPA